MTWRVDRSTHPVGLGLMPDAIPIVLKRRGRAPGVSIHEQGCV